MKTNKQRIIQFVLAGAITSGIALSLSTAGRILRAAEKTTDVAVPSIAQTKAIAEEGFLYGLPIAMNYAVMNEYAVDKNSGQFKAPFNSMKNETHLLTYKDTAVISPNSDTLYSLGWVDLRAEPIVISVPTVEKKRYFSVQLVDGSTYNYGYIGSRATGSEAGNYLLVGPEWKGEKPAGIDKVFHAGTDFGLTIFRTQLFNSDDMPSVAKVQAGYKMQPLSAFLGKPAPPAAPAIDFLPATTAGLRDHFVEYLDAALQYVPETAENKDIRAKLASIGIGPGKTVEFKDLSAEQKEAVMQGMKAGAEKLKDYLAHGGKDQNGWQVGGISGGDQAFFNGDWLKRAAIAQAGIYGNDFEEAMYPMTRTDSSGETLDTSKHNYTLTFPAGDLPPVNAFWSVTMYDGKTQFLIKNPINRYLINSPMLPDMKKNADGSLTIYIQKDSPGKDKEANWLPAPNDTVYIAMRLYWPSTGGKSILPPGEGTWQPPGIVKVK